VINTTLAIEEEIRRTPLRQGSNIKLVTSSLFVQIAISRLFTGMVFKIYRLIHLMGVGIIR